VSQLEERTLQANAVMADALAAFGSARQIDKCIEELGELATVLMKYRHGESSAADVIDELADVAIVGGTMKILFDPTSVDARIAVKLARLSRLVADQVAAKPEPKPVKPVLRWSPWDTGYILLNGQQWLGYVKGQDNMWLADSGNGRTGWYRTMGQAMRSCERFCELDEVPLWKP